MYMRMGNLCESRSQAVQSHILQLLHSQLLPSHGHQSVIFHASTRQAGRQAGWQTEVPASSIPHHSNTHTHTHSIATASHWNSHTRLMKWTFLLSRQQTNLAAAFCHISQQSLAQLTPNSAALEHSHVSDTCTHTTCIVLHRAATEPSHSAGLVSVRI